MLIKKSRTVDTYWLDIITMVELNATKGQKATLAISLNRSGKCNATLD
jgi:hypothetical protein